MGQRNPIRLRFWLAAMDVFHFLGAKRAYLWAIGRASANEDWGGE